MKTLLTACAFFALFSTGCRKDYPPKIENCTLEPTGGAACVLADGTRVWKRPSEIANYWATSQEDMAKFAAWCYKVPVEVARRGLARIRGRIYAEQIALETGGALDIRTELHDVEALDAELDQYLPVQDPPEK